MRMCLDHGFQEFSDLGCPDLGSQDLRSQMSDEAVPDRIDLISYSDSINPT